MTRDQYYIDQYHYHYLYYKILIQFINLANSCLILESINYNYVSYIYDVYLPIYSYKFTFSQNY